MGHGWLAYLFGWKGGDMIVGHMAPGILSFLAACGGLCQHNQQGFATNDLLLYAVFMGCCVMIYAMGFIADESLPHRFHHCLMYASFAVACLASLAENRKLLLHNASCLIWSAGFFSEALLLLGHQAKTALEDRMHFFAAILAAAAALPLLAMLIPEIEQRARNVVLYFIALQGLVWMMGSVYLGACFFKYIYVDEDGYPQWFYTPNSNMTWERTWGPEFNHTTIAAKWTLDTVWQVDWTTPHDIMVLHALIALAVVLNSMGFGLFLYRAPRHYQVTSQADCESVCPDVVGKSAC